MFAPQGPAFVENRGIYHPRRPPFSAALPFSINCLVYRLRLSTDPDP